MPDAESSVPTRIDGGLSFDDDHPGEDEVEQDERIYCEEDALGLDFRAVQEVDGRCGARVTSVIAKAKRQSRSARTPYTPRPGRERDRKPHPYYSHKCRDERGYVQRRDAVSEDAEALEE